VILYYLIAAVLSIVNFIFLLSRGSDKKADFYLKAIFLMICFANLGYLAVGLSHTLEEALLANKINYLGGCFIPPLMFCFISRLCNISLSPRIQWAMLLYSLFVYILVLFTGYSDLYYKTAVLKRFYDASTISIQRGPCYYFFSVILFGYMIANVLLIFFAFRKRSVSIRYITPLAFLQVFSIIAFLTGQSINSSFEVMPGIYYISSCILLALQIIVSKYSLNDSIVSTLQKNSRVGYVLFDKKLAFIGCNSVARTCIPSLSDYPIDRPIPEGHPAFFLYQWIDSFKFNRDAVMQLSVGGRFYEGSVHPLSEGRRQTGYLVALTDFTDRKKYLDILSDYNDRLEKQVTEQTRHITEIQRKITLSIADMVENRDSSTGGHIKRTSDVVRILMETLLQGRFPMVTEEFSNDLIRSAPMHDLGKIAIEDRILRKPGRFTPEEYALMQTHAVKSAEICENILRGVEEDHLVKVAVHVARSHHERWDGGGYPDHLKGEAIPLEARIMAIADVYDALVSKRCYKEAMDFDQAYQIMLSSMGSQFDPALEPVFTAARGRLEDYYRAVGS